MASQNEPVYVDASSPPRDEVGTLRRAVKEMAVHDWLVLAYLLGLNIAVLRGATSPARTLSQDYVFALLTILISALIIVRGAMFKHVVFAPLIYRCAIYGTVQLSYFFLATILPVVNPGSLDHGLYSIDLRFIGIEPAMAMDAIVNSFTGEWFAFFYFGYFFLLALHVIPILFFSRNDRLLGEFALGLLIVFCAGHTIYMLVPGFGPYRAMAQEFHHVLPKGMWHDLVIATVAEGGAQKDIFPSLHTAAPTFVAMFSYRHRDKLPFRYTWPFVTFFAVNIICATMYLRWHYLIDVIAGLALSSTAFVLAVRVVRWELARRREHGFSRAWPRFFEDHRERVGAEDVNREWRQAA